MKLRYITNNKRRYVSLGKEFPNRNPELNEIEVDDILGKHLLNEKNGHLPIWEEIKARRVKVEETKED